jgi:hypothetical protein
MSISYPNWLNTIVIKYSLIKYYASKLVCIGTKHPSEDKEFIRHTLLTRGYDYTDLSDNEMAKSHARHPPADAQAPKPPTSSTV